MKKVIFILGVSLLGLISSCKKDSGSGQADLSSYFVGTWTSNFPSNTVSYNVTQVVLAQKNATTLTLTATCADGHNFSLNNVMITSYYNGMGLLTIGESESIAGYGNCTFLFSGSLALNTPQNNLTGTFYAEQQTGTCNTGYIGGIVEDIFNGNK